MPRQVSGTQEVLEVLDEQTNEQMRDYSKNAKWIYF